MLRWILKTMGQGLMALIPITLTVGVVLALGVWVEALLSNPFKGLFPGSNEVYRMGMGIMMFCILMFLCGLLLKSRFIRRLLDMVESWIMQLPLVKTLYGAIKDIMQFLGGNGGKKGDMVVMVTLDNGWRQLGIVTRQDFSSLPRELLGGNDNAIAVYVPFSYQLGGFTYFIDRSQCQPIPGMSVEDAMRLALMGWLGSENRPEDGEKGENTSAPDKT